MELEHSFTVPVPKSRAWDVLLDVERVAPCMPGASLDSVDGDEIKGRIKVKVGPISMTYAGTAHFTERDPHAHVITLEAARKEQQLLAIDHIGPASVEEIRQKLAERGLSLGSAASGSAAGRASASSAAGNSTAPASTAPGAAVANGAAPSRAAANGDSGPAAQQHGPRADPADSRPPGEDAIDLLSVAGLPVLKRAIPALAGLVVAIAIVLRYRVRRRRGSR